MEEINMRQKFSPLKSELQGKNDLLMIGLYLFHFLITNLSDALLKRRYFT